jgi:hypothetical protein
VVCCIVDRRYGIVSVLYGEVVLSLEVEVIVV